MISADELKAFIAAPETARVELTRAAQDKTKFREAICAFSNDMAGLGVPGYLLIGIDEKDPAHRLAITDDVFRQIVDLRSDGQILPTPVMNAERLSHPEGNGEVLVVEVLPHPHPPVRFKGRVHIRVGPRKGFASEAEERILSERSTARHLSFDASACEAMCLDQLDLETFRQTYRPSAVAADVIAANNRSVEEQLAALRFFDLGRDCPTNAGCLLFGRDPLGVFPGAYVQVVRFAGADMASDVVSEQRFTGGLVNQLAQLDLFLKSLAASRPVIVSSLRERNVFAYPPAALRELLMNAVMHRDYQATAPIHFYEFNDRMEIQSPGGLYGEASPENFPWVTAYRNPVVAEAMKVLGYVNRYGRGVSIARSALVENGSPDVAFDLDRVFVLATIRKLVSDTQ